MGAGHLKIGDKIKQADGTTGLVANVTTVQQTREMFNLTVSEAHTYYVGQDGWLVHNATACELRQRRAGTTSNAGIPYDNNGFPIFDSLHDFTLPSDLRGATITDDAQMRAATRNLREALANDPNLAEKLGLTDAQKQAIKSGLARIPDLTWHHNQDGVTLELVNRAQHRGTPHSGGRQMTGGRP